MFIQEAAIPTNATGRFNLYPIGDLHCDRSAFQYERFKRWRSQIINDPFGVAVFVGDAVEGRTPGMKHFNTGSLSHPFRLNMESYVDFALEVCVRLLKPITEAGRPLFLVRGNHDSYMQWSGFSGALARRVGAKYLDGAGMVRLTTGQLTSSNAKRGRAERSAITTIYATHGWGGGRTVGPKLNNMMRLVDTVDADIYVAGHVHDQLNRVVKIPYLTKRGTLELKRRPRGFLRAPSFLDQAERDVSGYDQDKAFPMSDEGLVGLEVIPQHNLMRRFEAPF